MTPRPVHLGIQGAFGRSVKLHQDRARPVQFDGQAPPFLTKEARCPSTARPQTLILRAPPGRMLGSPKG